MVIWWAQVPSLSTQWHPSLHRYVKGMWSEPPGVRPLPAAVQQVGSSGLSVPCLRKPQKGHEDGRISPSFTSAGLPAP